MFSRISTASWRATPIINSRAAAAGRAFSTGPDLVPVAVAHGDGIGPEIMDGTLRILDAAKARIDPIPVKMGLGVYETGVSTGISDEAWEVIHRTKLLLKAPITTPRGGGVKSLNVTMRKTLGLFANIRPCFAMAPFVPTNFPDANVVVVRENEEVRSPPTHPPHICGTPQTTLASHPVLLSLCQSVYARYLDTDISLDRV